MVSTRALQTQLARCDSLNLQAAYEISYVFRSHVRSLFQPNHAPVPSRVKMKEAEDGHRAQNATISSKSFVDRLFALRSSLVISFLKRQAN